MKTFSTLTSTLGKISEEANFAPKSLAVEVTMKNHNSLDAALKIVNNLNGDPDWRAGNTSDSSANVNQLERMKVTSDQITIYCNNQSYRRLLTQKFIQNILLNCDKVCLFRRSFLYLLYFPSPFPIQLLFISPGFTSRQHCLANTISQFS